jgi:hypothetical protein
LLFPIPFRLMRTTHQNHHHHNRTDHEMFDLYYPTDSRVLKWIQWYGLLCGMFWPLVPLGAVLFALCPGLLRWQMLQKIGPARGGAIVANLERSAIRAMRLELLFLRRVFLDLGFEVAEHTYPLRLFFAQLVDQAIRRTRVLQARHR